MGNYISKIQIDSVSAQIRDANAQTLCVNLRSDLNSEINNRTNADTILQNNIDNVPLTVEYKALKNKKILIFGDSLSAENNYVPNWVTRLRNKSTELNLNLTIDNQAVDGMGLCSNTTTGGMIDIVNSVTATDYDLIIIFIGVNDRNNKIPLGLAGDTVRTSFYGGWNELYAKINAKWSNIPVFIIPPAITTHLNTDTTYIPLNCYRAIEQQICAHYGWNLIDVMRLNNYRPSNSNFSNWSDGLHVLNTYSQALCDLIVKQIYNNGVEKLIDIIEYTTYNSSLSTLRGRGILEINSNGNYRFGVYFDSIDSSIKGTQQVINTEFPIDNLGEIILPNINTVKSVYLYKNSLYVNLPNSTTWAVYSGILSMLSSYNTNF
jgi:lysophospholipase L1-like esterase